MVQLFFHGDIDNRCWFLVRLFFTAAVVTLQFSKHIDVPLFLSDQEDGQVESVQDLPVQQVSDSSIEYWKESECLSFLYEKLNAIKRVADEELDSPLKVLVCTYEKNGKRNNKGSFTF